MLVLHSGGVTRLAERSRFAASLILTLRDRDMWPPLVPSVVLIECLRGHPGGDAHTNAFLKTCDILEEVPERVARRAAQLRTKARRGSAVDALLVALAEPNGTVVTGDMGDLGALAEHATGVRVERI